MRNNFNTAPTTQPDWGNSAWGSATAAIETVSSYGQSSAWGRQESIYEVPMVPESRFGERLQDLKDKVIHGMGRKALDTVMNKLPSFRGKDVMQTGVTNLYEDPMQRQQLVKGWGDVRSNFGGSAEQVGQYGMSVGREMAGAGMTAAKEAVMKYYGLEKDENEKLRVARKIKFGKAVVKTVLNPIGTASSVGIRAGNAARKSAKTEGINQLRSARTNATEAWVSRPTYATNAPAESWGDWGSVKVA